MSGSQTAVPALSLTAMPTRALAGGATWGVAVLWLQPNPFHIAWTYALLLLAPLVLVPLALELLAAAWPGPHVRTLHLARVLQLPSAVLLTLAFLLPQGAAAAALAVPWLLTTGLVAVLGLMRLGYLGPGPPGAACADAGLGYLAVGGAWAACDRLAYRPLGFEEAIVVLTAAHFHYAGFLLPVLTGLAARQAPDALSRAAGVAIVAGVPLVAVGITATHLGASPLLECLAAWLMAAGGTLTAFLHLRLLGKAGRSRAVRSLWAIAAVALLGSMVLAAAYGCRFYVPVAWPDIPWMRVLHGTANAFGFGLAGVLGWHFALRVDPHADIHS